MVRRTLGTIVTLLALAPLAAAAPVTGGAESDYLAGTPRADQIVAGAGNDTLRGGRGADRLEGGAGRDMLLGGSGSDTLLGGAGADRALGGAGSDRIAGGAGNDLLRGGLGADRLSGGPGRDRIVGGSGVDVVAGGAGADRIVVRDGRADRVRCGPGRDLVVADAVDRVDSDCETVRRPATEVSGDAAREAEEEAILNPKAPEYAAARQAEATPLGTWVTSHDGFEVRIDGPTVDATAMVLAAHPFNEAPAVGEIHLATRVSVRYRGEGEASFDPLARLGAWDPVSGEVWRADDDECGYLPNGLPDRFLGTGAEVSGDVCWSLPAEAAGRVLAVDDDLTGTPSTILALR